METTANVKATNKSTPPVKASKQVKVIILIFLSVIFFIAITFIWLKSKSKSDENSPKQNPPRQTEIIYDASYDMSMVEYGKLLTFKTEPNDKILVELTNDWLPMWSSGRTETYDDDGVKRILEGTKYIKGPKSTPTQNYIFINNSNLSITIKIGRCESKENCNINF